MNRRDFLTGLFGTAAIAALGPAAILDPAKVLFNQEAWQLTITQVYADFYLNLMLHGTAAIEPIDEFPFIRSIPINEIYLSHADGSLLARIKAQPGDNSWTSLVEKPKPESQS